MTDGQHLAPEHIAAEHTPVRATEHTPVPTTEHTPVPTTEHTPVPTTEHTPVRTDEREAGVRPVECERCGATALVAKFSPQHTSVQWSLASARACAEFSARAAAGEQTELIDTCASMRYSIDRAVLQGRLEVSPP